jgi:hypothetical protein
VAKDFFSDFKHTEHLNIVLAYDYLGFDRFGSQNTSIVLYYFMLMICLLYGISGS